MTREEIKTYLAVGSTRSVCVDKSFVEQLPWYVRTVTIWRDWIVSIKFEPYGYDEAGVYFSGRFQSLDEIVATLEDYLNQPIVQWHNHTASGNYPDEPIVNRPNMSWEEIKAIARTLLPSTGNFVEMK
jgi:hypothetical protein